MPDTPEPQQKTMGLADLQTMAHNYHVPVSDGTFKQIVGDAENVAPEKAQAFEEYLKTAAQGLYPSLAPQIASGIPTAALLDPYRQVGKQVLGEGFEPNFQTDARARMALEGWTDPKTGRPAPMSLSDWTSYLKTEPSFGWTHSDQGVAARRMVLEKIHSEFGGK